MELNRVLRSETTAATLDRPSMQYGLHQQQEQSAFLDKRVIVTRLERSGVTVSIRSGTAVLFTQALTNESTTGVSINVATTVKAGHAFDFVIN